MKTLDRQQTTVKIQPLAHAKVENLLLPDSEKNAEALALFEKLHKSEKFTLDAAHQAFGKLASGK
jgi:hypothetical protein